MNLKNAQFIGNGSEIVRLFARIMCGTVCIGSYSRGDTLGDIAPEFLITNTMTSIT
jgi:hypothetical protein